VGFGAGLTLAPLKIWGLGLWRVAYKKYKKAAPMGYRLVA